MKRLLSLLMPIAFALLPVFAAQAQGAYPTRPVKIICGFPAGTTLDIVTRIFAQKIEAALGQPFVIENKAGASGNLGNVNIEVRLFNPFRIRNRSVFSRPGSS